MGQTTRVDAVTPRRLASVWPLVLAGLLGCPDSPLEQAQAAEKAQKFQEAGEHYIAAAKAHPANLATWDGAVEIFCKKEVRVGRCLEVLDMELKLLGNLDRHVHVASGALDRRARARLDQGMVQAASSDIERAERLGPPPAPVLVTKARILLAKGDRSEAVELLVRAKKLDSQNREAETLLQELSVNPGAEDPPEPEGFGGKPR